MGVALGFKGGLPALVGRAVTVPTEVPLSEVTRAVACGGESLGKGACLERQLQGYDGVDKSSVRSTVTRDVLGDAKACLVLAGLQIGTGGGTDGASIELGEA